MIGLDTNLLVRIFAADDPTQRNAAVRLIDGLKRQKACINIVVVVELIWTLRRTYKFDRDDIAAVLRKLTEHPKLFVPDKDILREAAHRSREQGGQAADHIIALLNNRHGCSTTYTFDEEAAGHHSFSLLEV